MSRRRGKKGASKVGELLPGLLKGLGLDSRMEEARLMRQWTEIVGEAVASRSTPREIRGGELVVEVENNVWMHEMRYQTHAILEKIKSRFPQVKLRGIRLELKRERSTE